MPSLLGVGNFFTIWDDNWQEHPLSTKDFEPLIALVENQGFVHVGYDVLGDLYDGPNEHYKKENWSKLRGGVLRKVRASWWDRYFDYM